MLHPGKELKKSYVTSLLENEEGVFVAVSDFMKLVPEQITRWVPGDYYILGTDGFGRSETRENTRRFFEIDAESIVIATLHRLEITGKVKATIVKKAIKDLGVDPDKVDPLLA